MFEYKNIFVLNKKDKEAIIYQDVDGRTIRLTREAFASEENCFYGTTIPHLRVWRSSLQRLTHQTVDPSAVWKTQHPWCPCAFRRALHSFSGRHIPDRALGMCRSFFVEI